MWGYDTPAKYKWLMDKFLLVEYSTFITRNIHIFALYLHLILMYKK